MEIEKNTTVKLARDSIHWLFMRNRRATIPLPSGNLLLVTIDNSGGQQQIMEKILNEVKVHDYYRVIFFLFYLIQ